MDLTDYLVVLRKRWLLVTLVTLLGLSGAGAASWWVTPQYTAETQVYVSTRPATATAGDLVNGSNFAQQQVRTYVQLVTTPAVLEPVLAEPRLERTLEQLTESITAEAPVDTSLITMTVTDPDPQLVAELANSIASSLITVIGGLEAADDGSASPVRVTVVQPATVPESPSSPDVPMNLALGLLAGLAVGVGLAFLLERLDTAVRSERDVRTVTTAPYLGAIAHDRAARTAPVLSSASRHSLRAEAFRQVRTNLQFISAAERVHSLVVTSSVVGEGKSTTAANLAVTLASTGARVVLVEGDLRRPKLGEYLGLESAAGLTTVLAGAALLADVVQPWGARDPVDVVLSGQSPPNPSELLGSAAMTDLIGTLEANYDIVVIDAPPLLPVTDAAVIAGIVDGALVVVGSGSVSTPQLTSALEALDRVQARLLGYVVNRVPADRASGYGYASWAAQDDEALRSTEDDVTRPGPRPAPVAPSPAGGSRDDQRPSGSDRGATAVTPRS